MIYRDVSACIEGPFFNNGKPFRKDYNRVENAAGGGMICFLSNQVFSSEPSFITEQVSIKLVLVGAACWCMDSRGLSENG